MATRLRLGAGTAFGALGLSFLSSGAAAQTCQVTTNADSGAGSLRACVATANGSAAIDEVRSVLPAATNIDLTSAEIAVTSNVLLDGNNPFSITSVGGSVFQIFELSGGSTFTIGPNVTLLNDNFAEAVRISDDGNTLIFRGNSIGDGTGIYVNGADNKVVVSGRMEVDGGNIVVRGTRDRNRFDISGDLVATNGGYGLVTDGADTVIDVSGTITATGNNSRGIFASGTNQRITISGDIETNGNNAPGVIMQSTQAYGGSTLTLSGSILTTGNDSHALAVGQEDNVVNIRAGATIETQGANSIGISSGMINSVVNVAGSISTAGAGASGLVFQDAFARGTNTINIARAGSVVTSNDTASGVVLASENNTVNVDGLIETGGSGSHGIHTASGRNTINVAGSIETAGIASFGVDAAGGNNTIRVNGDITTAGDSAQGIRAQGVGNVVVVTGLVRTLGPNAVAVGVSTDSSVTVSGRIESRGGTNTAIFVGTGNLVDVSGSLLLSGSNAQGIVASGANNRISVSGDISVTGGTASLGILTGNGNNVVDISGSVTSNSAAEYAVGMQNDDNLLIVSGSVSSANLAIYLSGTGNILELRPGYTIEGLASLNGALTVLGGSGEDAFDLDLIGTQYTGFSVGEKRGPSTWTLTGTNGAAWTVFDGTLLVDGTAGDMTVNGGVLGGTGTVGITMISGGALAPGNSVGTLTVAGNLTFAAGGYLVEVEGAAADLTNVTGTAALTGGIADITYLPTGSIGRQYTILTAAGGLGGTEFAGITDNAPGIASTLSYDANNVYLNVDLAMAAIPGLTTNTSSVASALDAYFDRTGTIPAAFALLDAAGLNPLTGEIATGAMGAGFQQTTQFLGLIGDPGAGDSGGSGGPLGYAAEAGMRADLARWSRPLSSVKALAALSGESENAAAKAAETLALTSAHAADYAAASPWQLWGAAWGGGEKVRGDATVVGSADLTARTWGIASGVTKTFDGGRIGIALGGAGTSFSLAGALGSGNTTSFNAGVYGTGTFGDGYVSAALAYGYHATRTSRAVPGDVLSARFGAQTFGGRIETGHRFHLGGVALTPYAAAEAIAYRLPSYTETSALGGPFALTYAAQTETSVRTELGARTAVDLGGSVKLTGRAAWVWNADSARAVTAGFQALPGTTFTINGAEPARHAALVEAGVEAAFGSNVTAKLTATGEFSRNVTSLGATAKVGIRW